MALGYIERVVWDSWEYGNPDYVSDGATIFSDSLAIRVNTCGATMGPQIGVQCPDCIPTWGQARGGFMGVAQCTFCVFGWEGRGEILVPAKGSARAFTRSSTFCVTYKSRNKG